MEFQLPGSPELGPGDGGIPPCFVDRIRIRICTGRFEVLFCVGGVGVGEFKKDQIQRGQSRRLGQRIVWVISSKAPHTSSTDQTV